MDAPIGVYSFEHICKMKCNPYNWRVEDAIRDVKMT